MVEHGKQARDPSYRTNTSIIHAIALARKRKDPAALEAANQLCGALLRSYALQDKLQTWDLRRQENMTKLQTWEERRHDNMTKSYGADVFRQKRTLGPDDYEFTAEGKRQLEQKFTAESKRQLEQELNHVSQRIPYLWNQLTLALAKGGGDAGGAGGAGGASAGAPPAKRRRTQKLRY